MSDELNTHTKPNPQIVLPPVTEINVGAYVGKYIQLRNKIKEMEDINKEKLRPFKEMLVALNGLLLNHLSAVGTDSAAIKGVGTVYKTQRASATIADGDEFRRHVIGSEDYDLIDFRANAVAVKKFIDENGTPPPGVNYSVVLTAGVRKD